MMVDILTEDESEPTSYSDAPSGLSTAAAALDADMIWRRLESWIAYRWEERTVVWIVEGPGTFRAPLRPATITTHERWDGSAWGSTTLDAAPLGLAIPIGTFRLSATVGEDAAPPAPVQEAFRRLAEYLSESTMAGAPSGVSSMKDVYADGTTVEFQVSPTWKARAMQYSGAADLLREFRR